MTIFVTQYHYNAFLAKSHPKPLNVMSYIFFWCHTQNKQNSREQINHIDEQTNPYSSKI